MKIHLIYLLTILSIGICKAFECPQPNGWFRDPTNPHKFYECVEGRLYEFVCPSDLVFDTNVTVCVNAETPDQTNVTPTSVVTSSTSNASTNSTITTISTNSTTVAQTSAILNFVCPQPNGYFTDPTNPHIFYDCVEGKAYKFTCADPLVFDEGIKNCVFADSIQSTVTKPTSTVTNGTTTTTTTQSTVTNSTTVTTNVPTITPTATTVTTANPVTPAPGVETTRARHTIPPLF